MDTNDTEEEMPDRTPAYARAEGARITKRCTVCGRPFLVAPRCQGAYGTCSPACAAQRKRGWASSHVRGKE